MTTVPQRGPTFTYITDEDLDFFSQQRVIRKFVSAADSLDLRVAFRLPRWSDVQVAELLAWYGETVSEQGIADVLLPPLVHDRPELAYGSAGARLWLSWRNLDLVREQDIGRFTVSVHGLDETTRAIEAGAQEILYGHVFSSESHPGEPGRGIPELQDVLALAQALDSRVQVTAIGGMNRYTIPEIGKIRFANVAGMRIISRSSDILAELNAMREAWIAAWIAAEVDEHQRSPFGHPSNLFF